MAHKTLYVSPGDTSVWAAAQRVADRKGISLTRVVVEALEHDLPRAAAEMDEQPTDKFGHIAADAA